MKLSLLLSFVFLLFTSGNREDSLKQALQPEAEPAGSWIGSGIYYAGSKIPVSTTFVFNSDKTFAAIEKAKGMPALKGHGEWLVYGKTLKLKFKKAKKTRIDEIAYKERNGGPLDIIKPVPDDSSGIIT